jgi:mRNA interferase RelE/StbE
MSYTVQVKNSALKELRKLPKAIADQVAREIDSLSVNPRPPGHKKLKGNNNLYRLRLGDYRIVYHIHDKILIVLVIRMGNRKDVYRGL